MSESAPDPDMLARCAEIIRAGGLVAFPTETVYGLGANGLDGHACTKIYEVKNRPYDKGLILHIAHEDDADAFAYVNDKYLYLREHFRARPLTYILPKKPSVPEEVSKTGTVAFRRPPNAVASMFLSLCGVPVAAPSANMSGMPAPHSAEEVINAFDGRIDAIIDAGVCGGGVPSTIISLAGDVYVVREGAVPSSEVFECLENM